MKQRDDIHTSSRQFFRIIVIAGGLAAFLVLISNTFLGRAFDWPVAILVFQVPFLLLLLQWFPDKYYSQIVSLLLLTGILSYRVFNQGQGEIAVIWLFLLPPLAFLLLGARWGIFWSMMTLGLVSWLTTLTNVNPFGNEDASVFSRQIIMSLAVLSIFVFFYQRQREQYNEQARKTEKELEEINARLRDGISKSREADKDRKNALEELQAGNVELERSKLATLNVLEDLQSERVKLEEAVAKQQALLSSIADGVIVTDKENRIVYVNSSAETILGFSFEEMNNKKWLAEMPLVTDESGKPISAAERTTYSPEKDKEIDSKVYYLQTKASKIVPVSVSVAAVEVGKTTTGAIIVFRDVTEITRVDKAKTEFVSLASHQLRTPLSTINWYSELLLDEDVGKLNEGQIDYLTEIQNGGRRMSDLVSSLLNVSRIELGTFAIDPLPINIVDLVKAEVKALTPVIEAHKHTVSEEYAPDLPKIELDSKLMGIVIENLITNASKYTPAGGNITLRIYKVTGAKLIDSIHKKFLQQRNSVNLPDKKEEYLAISVQDTGYGIPTKEQDQIFSKLYRASNVTAKDVQGTGLGLYIVQAIVFASNGFIWFESEENKGSTFFIALPMSGMKNQSGEKKLE